MKYVSLYLLWCEETKTECWILFTAYSFSLLIQIVYKYFRGEERASSMNPLPANINKLEHLLKQIIQVLVVELKWYII